MTPEAAREFLIQVDLENNDPRWWSELRASDDPNLAWVCATLERHVHDTIRVPLDLLQKLQALPGWSDPDAPAYAPHPLVVIAE